MFSALKFAYDYFASKKGDENDDLEVITERLESALKQNAEPETSKNTVQFEEGCFYKYGIVTAVTESYIMIDNKYICDLHNVLVHNIQKGKKVEYLAFQLDKDKEIKISKVVSICDDSWDAKDNQNEKKYDEFLVEEEEEPTEKLQLMEKNLVGMVKKREGRLVCIEPNDLWFDLNKVSSDFIPLVGDWLKATSIVSVDGEKDDLCGDILQIKFIEPLRSKIHVGMVTSYDPSTKVGQIDNRIIFHKGAFSTGYIPCIRDTVTCDTIESNQGRFTWRCLSLAPLHQASGNQPKGMTITGLQLPADMGSLVQDKNGIVISKDTRATLEINEEKFINVTVKNTGYMIQILCKSSFLSKTSQSQLTLLSPATDMTMILNPSQSIVYKFSCKAKFVGTSEELFLFSFKHFKIARLFRITVNAKNRPAINRDSQAEGFNKRHVEVRYDNFDQDSVIPGIKPIRSAAFAIRNGVFRIPEKYWKTVVPILNSRKSQTECEIQLLESMPFLSHNLTFQNYTERFHALLYLEEIGMITDLQRFDIESVCMKKSGEFLVMEVPGLSEKRPSLISGDKAIVSFKWSTSEANMKYEGVIHKTKSSEIYLKFDPKFHETYNSEDCYVTFTSSATTLRRAHQALNHAVSYLGKEFLFPSQVFEKEPQYVLREMDEEVAKCNGNDETSDVKTIEEEDNMEDCNGAIKKDILENYTKKMKTRKLIWYNKRLNKYQKDAVKNILRGVARPLPYVIFGPPGTGKTITLCETILQILAVIPESRILVATPSNSSSNLIAERLLDSEVLKPGDLVRLVAHHYLENSDISEKLLPYCAVGSLRNTNFKRTAKTLEEENSQKSFTAQVLGRHRITIGTCSALGILYNMGFPRGHFTHVVVDEAGQATEPEILVPLTFIHSNSGQVILAGDPMQLGPVVQSNLANYFGLGESFLSRLLQQFPYQRDPDGFETGYDPRLVTKLLMNYRSLPEILTLPNSLFYDSDLQPQISAVYSEEVDLLKLLADILPERKNSLPPAIVFHGVGGTNYQDTDSPSWYNPEEATQVYLYFLKLSEKGVTANDIGIITPYRKQVSQIRDLLMDLEIEIPKVGSVEEFQGQERKIIILSTVRSAKNLISEDVRHALGFVSAPQRLNVAITRARALLIIIGNPYLLSHDPYWRSVIDYCYVNQAFTGCNTTSERNVSAASELDNDL